MALFVYITERCKEDARKHSILDDVQRFKERVEKAQSVDLFNPFPPPYLVKKKMGGQQGRLIAEKRIVGDHLVVIFLALMIRGDRSYEDHFGPDPVAYGRQHFAQLIKAGELEGYLADRTRKDPPKPKPEPSDAENDLLYNAFAHRQAAGSEEMIYETEDWKTSVSSERVAQQLNLFAPALVEGLKLDHGLHQLKINRPGWGLWVVRIPDGLLLVTPLTGDNNEVAERLARQYADRLESGSQDAHLRLSRRAYPAYILADDETWIALQKDPVANMALSPEESKVLLHARSSEGSFPLFINGRAGSGKSTILQYLFADLLFYYLTLKEKKVAPPLYLTANGELLRVARTFVDKILRTEAAFCASGSPQEVDASERVEVLNDAFKEFHPFLLSMLSPAVRTEKFSPAKRVDYARFRRLWAEWFSRDRIAGREFGPDVSWHVIRSYIKGISSDGLLDDEEYREIPENQVTVSVETYRKIYERVWIGRYQKVMESQGLWDDQDLARYILDHNLVRASHPAVCCDEAQDFTRIELELILRLNLFSQRSVPPHELGRIPFAFAGDPFQTLNPTGFRWDAIKASFVEKFIRALDPLERSGKLELSYSELLFNYRSAPPIVRFNNSIQALRAGLFKLTDLLPQTSWTDAGGNLPVTWFHGDDEAFWKKFTEIGSMVVVIPCNEGEERDFVENDPVLKSHIPIEEGVPRNVLSASRAKGREYPSVVVYGFGAVCDPDLAERLRGGDISEDEMAGGRTLAWQYFINRLYVSTSRPKQRLIVVDTHDGIQSLWAFATDEGLLQNVAQRASGGKNTWTQPVGDPQIPVVEAMVAGKAEDLTRTSAADPLENAQSYEEEGLARKDAFLLRQAALNYRAGGKHDKAGECRARAEELDGSFFAAGEAYEKAGLIYPEAVRCFWNAGEDGRQPILSLGSRKPDVARSMEYRWVRILTDAEPACDAIRQALFDLTDSIQAPEVFVEVSHSTAWRESLRLVLERACTRTAPEAVVLSKAALKLAASGFEMPFHLLAKLCYIAGDHGSATTWWEKAGETDSPDYLRAKAFTAPYPDNLSALAKVGEYQNLLDQVNAHSADVSVISPEGWSAVAEAHLNQLNFDAALDAAWRSKNCGMLSKIASMICRTDGAGTCAGSALPVLVTSLVVDAQWEVLIRFASSLEFLPDPSWASEKHKELVEIHSESMLAALIKALARSEHLPQAPGHQQRQISDFLRRHLRVKDGSWKQWISVPEAGSALERAGRFTDALAFYDAIRRDTAFSEEEKVLARKRGIVCRGRQLAYENSSTTVNRGKVRELEAAIQTDLKELNLSSVSELPSYPEVSVLEFNELLKLSVPAHVAAPETSAVDRSLPPTAPLPLQPVETKDRVVVDVGGIEVEYSRSKARCNFKHHETMDTASLRLQESTLTGDGGWQPLAERRWKSDAWGIHVFLTEDFIKIESDELGIQVVMRIPPHSGGAKQ